MTAGLGDMGWIGRHPVNDAEPLHLDDLFNIRSIKEYGLPSSGRSVKPQGRLNE